MVWTCFGILILLSSLYTVHTLTCLSCTETQNWSHGCRHNYTTCNPDEQCFLEQIRNSTNHRRTYTAGCRSNHLCNLIEMLGGNYDSRRNVPSDRTATICSECCATKDHCNDRLCLASHHHVATTAAPLQCIQCSDVSDINACKTNIVTCGSDEECFMEVTEDEHDVVRYNAGCRSKLLCEAQQHSDPVVGRKKRELALDCFGCCSNSSQGHVCNAHLCGVDAPQNRCLNCGLVSSVGVCHNTTFCQPTEVCFNSINLVSGLIRYYYGCETKSHCNAFIANGGVAGVTHGKRHDATDGYPDICSSCCSGTLCNREDCYKIAANMTHFRYP